MIVPETILHTQATMFDSTHRIWPKKVNRSWMGGRRGVDKDLFQQQVIAGVW